MDWHTISKILEEHKEKSTIQLEEIFNKDHSWVSRARKFYNATEEEKKELALKHRQFEIFYEMYLDYKKEQETINKNKEIIKKTTGLNEKEFILRLISLLEIIKGLALEVRHCNKERAYLIKENTETALDINRKQNEINELKKELNEIKKYLSFYKKLYYTASALNLFMIIIYFIKG